PCFRTEDSRPGNDGEDADIWQDVVGEDGQGADRQNVKNVKNVDQVGEQVDNDHGVADRQLNDEVVHEDFDENIVERQIDHKDIVQDVDEIDDEYGESDDHANDVDAAEPDCGENLVQAESQSEDHADAADGDVARRCVEGIQESGPVHR